MAWKYVNINNSKDVDNALKQFEIELNRKLKFYLDNIGTLTSTVFSEMTLSNLTASRLVSSSAAKKIVSVADLTTWIAGTTDQVVVTDNGDGTLTLSLPQDIATDSNVQFGTGKFGNVSGGNYSEFESDGTYKAVGDATIFNDLMLPIVPRTTGVGRPTLATFSGDIREHTMAINDVTDVNATELLHNWAEGTEIELHVHWATNGSDGTDRYVKWQISYTWANKLSKGGTTAFAAASTQSAEATITASTPDKTHIYTSIYSFTPTGGKVGAYLCMALKRIAASGTAPTSDPWILAVGVHFKNDTLGSRSLTGK